MSPFFEDKKNVIALESKYLFKMVGYTKLDIYLASLPLAVFCILMFILIKIASNQYKANKNDINSIAVQTHTYLLILFLTVLILYGLGAYRVISPYLYGY